MAVVIEVVGRASECNTCIGYLPSTMEFCVMYLVPGACMHVEYVIVLGKGSRDN